MLQVDRGCKVSKGSTLPGIYKKVQLVNEKFEKVIIFRTKVIDINYPNFYIIKLMFI